MMNSDQTGLYVHIPFCKRKCRYCDFYSVVTFDNALLDKYTTAICAEIKQYNRAEKTSADSVFFGGGTPSLFGPQRIGRILSCLYDTFSVSSDAEITLEANPATVTADALRDYRLNGINRISVGVQSLVDTELATLGRLHDSSSAADTVHMCRSAGFDNISIDLMYAIPGQTVRSFAYTLHRILSLSPEHISAYSLILEEGTELYSMRHGIGFPGEDEELGMYELVTSTLSSCGYEHYEVSNYARAGYRCRHNMKYWNMTDYIGFGPAAHSKLGTVRYFNSSDILGYINAPNALRSAEESMSASDMAEEYLLLGLRTSEGIDPDEYFRLVGHSLAFNSPGAIDRYISLGLLDSSNGRIRLTDRGMYVSNSIICELL